MQNENHVISYTHLFPIENNKDNFIVGVNKVDNEVLLSPVNKLRNQILIISIIIIIISIILGLFISHIISKPLVKLKEATDQVSKGNFEVDTPKRTKIDEVNSLSESFDRTLASMKLAVSGAIKKEKRASKVKPKSGK